MENDKNKTQYNPNSGKLDSKNAGNEKTKEPNGKSVNNSSGVKREDSNTQASKVRGWAKIAGAGLSAAHAIGGLPYVFGWLGELKNFKTDLTGNDIPDPAQLDPNPAQSVNDQMSHEEAHRAAYSEKGPNGYYVYKDKPYPTAYPEQLGKLSKSDQDTIAYNLMEQHHETENAPLPLAIPREIQILTAEDLGDPDTYEDAFKIARTITDEGGHFFEFEGKYYSTFTPDEVVELKKAPDLYSEYQQMLANEDDSNIDLENWYDSPTGEDGTNPGDEVKPVEPEVIPKPIPGMAMELKYEINGEENTQHVQVSVVAGQGGADISLQIAIKPADGGNPMIVGSATLNKLSEDGNIEPPVVRPVPVKEETDSGGEENQKTQEELPEVPEEENQETQDELPEVPENTRVHTEFYYERESIYEEKFVIQENESGGLLVQQEFHENESVTYKEITTFNPEDQPTPPEGPDFLEDYSYDS